MDLGLEGPKDEDPNRTQVIVVMAALITGTMVRKICQLEYQEVMNRDLEEICNHKQYEGSTCVRGSAR